MTILKKIQEKIPSCALQLLLAIVYLGCGFLIGYHQGQRNYVKFLEKLLAPQQQEVKVIDE